VSLLKRDPVIVKQLTAQGATLIIERNKEKMFNVQELASALKPIESTDAPAAKVPEQTPAQQQSSQKQQAATAPAPAKPIPVHIRRIAVDTVVKYVDSRRRKEYDLSLRLTGSDLFTVPAEGQPSSLLVLRGSLPHEKDSFETDLNAILEPLTDPKNPTFNASGSILDIDAAFLGDLLKKNNVESRSFSIKPSITCTKGQLKGSRIDLVLNDLKVYGAEIGTTTLKLPLNGTLTSPVLDLTGALQSLFSEQSVKIGKALGMRELKKELSKQLGVDTNAAPPEMLVGALTNNVKEIADSPALQQLIGQVVPGAQTTNSAATNQTQTLGDAVGEALSEQLGKNVKELKGNEELKKSLKSLSNSLLGK